MRNGFTHHPKLITLMREQGEPVKVPLSINTCPVVNQGKAMLVDTHFATSGRPGGGKLMAPLEMLASR